MAGGNYGGNSIPTHPVAAGSLLAGMQTTYKDYVCTSIVATAATGTFTYDGLAIPFDIVGQPINLLVYPNRLTAAIDVIFMCYDCSCNSSMTGITTPSAFYTGTTSMFRPTIIGGGGLNS